MDSYGVSITMLTVISSVVLVTKYVWCTWGIKKSKSKNHTDILNKARFSLNAIFTHLGVPESHGIRHADRVMRHASRACRADSVDGITMSDDEVLAIKLAALLHDADDRKYFSHNNFENARAIMHVVCPDLEPLVIQMIGYVSSSKNGDDIPKECRGREWMLYPRWSDRLEAIGWIGVVRAWEYSLEMKRPLFTNKTPKAKNVIGLKEIASEKRYLAYNGRSASMIDHYYDKLLRLNNFETKNLYLRQRSRDLLKPLISVCLAFGNDKLDDSILVTARLEAASEESEWGPYDIMSI